MIMWLVVALIGAIPAFICRYLIMKRPFAKKRYAVIFAVIIFLLFFVVSYFMPGLVINLNTSAGAAAILSYGILVAPKQEENKQ